VNYRESYGMFICCGILFNHESPRRGKDFVTQKIATQVAEIVKGKRDIVTLGNLDTKRDWGYAPEYVEAMHIMMQRAKPDDYVVATGETHTIKEFLEATVKAAGIEIPAVVFDGGCVRPADVAELRGDPSKVNGIGWRAVTKYEKLAEIMFKAAMERIG
jgi:GDPmannose 4,6-dehydratase